MSNRQIKNKTAMHLRICAWMLILGVLLFSSCSLPTVTVVQTQSAPPIQSQPATTTQNNPTPTTKTHLLTITTTGEGTTTPASGSYTYEEGKPVAIFANGAEGWQFDGWSGDASGALTSILVSMDDDKNITANFSKVQTYNLTIEINGIGKANLSPGIHSFASGVTVNLTATPGNQQEFYGWSGAVVQSNPSLTIKMDKDMTLAANFSAKTYSLTLAVDGAGSTDPSVGRHTYEPGSVVKISAIPDPGWQFTGWNGNVAAPDSASTTVKIDQYQNVTANFNRALIEKVVYGPETRKIGTGNTSWSISMLPGEKTEFNFTISGDKVNYWVAAPDGKLLLKSGTPALSGQSTFPAAIQGYYWLTVESTGGSDATTVTMSYKVYTAR